MLINNFFFYCIFTDFYGKRLVTCSSDQHIKVFDKVEKPSSAAAAASRMGGGDSNSRHLRTSTATTTNNNSNNNNNNSTSGAAGEASTADASAVAKDTTTTDDTIESLTTDDGAVWMLSDSWKAHDSTIVKVVFASPEFGQVIASCSYDSTVRIFEEDAQEAPNSGKRWKRRAIISDFHGALYDIAFAPPHLGLKLAAIDSDGMFHVHAAPDPNNLTQWESLVPEESLITKQASKNRQSSFALSWCPSMFFKEYIAVSAQDSAYIYERSGLGKYKRVAQFPSSNGLIRDIAWAPSMGRQFQLIALASVDGNIRIYKVTRKNSCNNSSSSSNDLSTAAEPVAIDANGSASGSVAGVTATTTTTTTTGLEFPSPLEVELISTLSDHHSEVWRVSWNITGTILASAGNDGNIRFWKASYSNEFRCMAVVSAEQRR
jgi:nucleoporin SEH1